MLHITIILYILKLSIAWDNGLRDKYDSYGEDWIFMPDGNGHPQVAVLKGHEEPPNDFESIFAKPINFLLYTRYNPDQPILLDLNDTETLRKSPFSPKVPTKFITHGWKSSAFSASVVNIKQEYLKHGNYNVFIVNWEPMAASTFYLGPMHNTAKVGALTAEFIDFLHRETALTADSVHFIGHSLGAHVGGNTGENVKHGKLGRLTGLDPALPGFHLFQTDKGRLSPDDAKFVDIIHSCGGVLGYMQPLGIIDFYPNAGVAVQPGCCCIPEIIEACSHGRSYQYFAESINSKYGLRANKCKNWDDYQQGHCDNAPTTLLGEHVDKSAKGSYFLRTRSEPPYAFIDEKDNNNLI